MTTATLQPGATGNDTFIASGGLATKNYGGNPSLIVGHMTGQGIRHILLKFDLSSIPSGAVVTAATLSLWLNQPGDWRAANDRTLNARRLLRNWVEAEATWNQYSSGNNWQTAGGEGANDRNATVIGTSALSVTDLVGSQHDLTLDNNIIQGWLTGLYNNYGVILQVGTESEDQYSFYSSDETAQVPYRPRLVVTYIVPVEALALGLTETPTVFDLTNNWQVEVANDPVVHGLREAADIFDPLLVHTDWTGGSARDGYLLRIDRLYQTNALLASSVAVRDVLEAVNTMTCEVYGPSVAPAIGQEIELLHGVEAHGAAQWSQSGLGNFEAAKLNDGVIDGRAFELNQSGIGAYLQLDLGAALADRRALRSVRLYASGLYTASWDIQYSNDGLSWTTVVSAWASGVYGAYATIAWEDVGARRFWRLVKTDAAAVGAGVTEVQWSTESAMVLFHGTIDEIAKVWLEPDAGLRYELECVDWNQLGDRRLIAEDYAEMLAGDIARDAVDQYLTEDGVGDLFIEDGPVITKLVSNYLSARRLLSDLAELCGFSWYIDYDKQLHFFPHIANAAPFVLNSGASGTVRSASVDVRTSRTQYRNHQYVRAGHDITDDQVEVFAGDGQRRTFTVGFPIAAAPTVSLDGAAQTVGVRGVDEGVQWYWQKDSGEVSQDTSEDVLTTGQVLTVTYQGLFPVIIEIRDDAKVAERQAVEGGSGLYQAVENHPQLDGENLAIEKTLALLRKYGRLPTMLSFETWQSGLKAGQLITVNIPELGLTGEWLLEDVSVTDLSGRRRLYRGQAVDGEHLGGWLEFFRKFAEAGQQFIARENENIQSVTSFADQGTIIDSLTPTPDAVTVQWLVDVALVDQSEVT